MGYGFIILLLIVIAVGAYYAHVAQQKRQEELRALADELRWHFDPSRDSTYDSRFPQFEIFRRGHSRYAYNTMHGSIMIDGAAWPAVMGDYHYKITSGSGKNRSTRTYRFSYAVLSLPFLGVPELTIRREGLFDKLASFVGFDDIDFESGEFSDQFHVKSSDKRFAFAVIHPQMMEFLLKSESPTVDCERGACLLHDGRRSWTPVEFRGTLDWARQFFELWPSHLTSTLESL